MVDKEEDEKLFVVNPESEKKRGFPLLQITFLIMLTLKLLGKTTISWFWVLLPLWIVPAIVGAILLIGMCIVGILTLEEKYTLRKRKKEFEKRVGKGQY